MARKKSKPMEPEEELEDEVEELEDELDDDKALTFERRDRYVNLVLAVAATGFVIWQIWRIFHPAVAAPGTWAWVQAWWVQALLGLGFAYAAYGYWYEFLFNRLVVAEDGLIYYSVDGAFDAEWEDVIRIGTIRRRKSKREYGLVLKKSVRRENLFSFQPYVAEWEGSELKKALEEHAGHLFSEDKSLDGTAEEAEEEEPEEQTEE
jgi:hypothetical protein